MTELPPPRILKLSLAEYQRHPAFSSSIAALMVSGSPELARDAYDRRSEQPPEAALEDDGAPRESASADDEKQKNMERGSVYHAFLLGRGEERLRVLPTAILSKNGAIGTADARAARDQARRAGQIPVKEPDLVKYREVASTIARKLAAAGHPLDGTSELMIEWFERTAHGPVLCKGALDQVRLWRVAESGDLIAVDPHDPEAAPTVASIIDLKMGPCHPPMVERKAELFGYGIQEAAYKRALCALFPTLQGRVEFHWLFADPRRPFPVWTPPSSGSFRELGERRWVDCLRTWAQCQQTGEWPDYNSMAQYSQLGAPVWVLRQHGFTPEEQ